jgi:hypothetical protein
MKNNASEAWFELLNRVNPYYIEGYILAIDPGHTIGYAFFNSGNIVSTGSKLVVDKLGIIDWVGIQKIVEVIPDLRFIVMEEYRVYEQYAASHIQSTVPTLRIIGGIQMLACLKETNVVFQSASRAKSFCTDIKLKRWNMLTKSLHKNDAIRHATAFYLFHEKARK